MAGSLTDTSAGSSPLNTAIIGQSGNDGVITDPYIAWEQGATGQAYLGGLSQLFGGSNPFTNIPVNIGRDYGDRPELPGTAIPTYLIYEITNALDSAKADQDGFDWTPDDLKKYAAALWADPEIQTAYQLRSAGIGALISARLLGTGSGKNYRPGLLGLPSKPGSGTPQYATVEEEVAAMNPIQRASYYRSQREQAESDFKKLHETAYSLFNFYFGRDPSHEEAAAVTAAGNGKQQEDYVRARPSGVVDGMNIGQYTDVRKVADGISNTIYGHDSNAQIIKEAFDQGLTTKDGLQYYYDQLPLQPGKNIDPIVYNGIYASAAQHTKAVWNQEPHPVDLHSIWTAAGSPGALPVTQVAQAAQGTDPTPHQQVGEPAPSSPPTPATPDPTRKAA